MIRLAVRPFFTMRAAVERNQQEAVDGYGGKAIPARFVPVVHEPCYAWSSSRLMSRVVAFSDMRAIRIEELQVAFPKGSRVKEEDRVTEVVDRRGQVKFAGPFRLKTLQDKVGYRAAVLEKIGT